MTRLVLRGARWPGDVAVEGGRIAAVGEVPEEPGDQVLRVDGDIVTAGLVNTHHHFYQWMTRGWAFDQTLFGWLTTLYPVWARLTPEDVEAASAVAMGELALTGCTTAADHHYLVPGGDDSVFDAIASAARTIGVRAHIARGSMDLGQSKGGLPPDSVVEDLDAILASTKSVHDRLHDGDRLVVTVAPCSPFSVTPELMRESAELARRPGAAPAHPPGRDPGRGAELPGAVRPPAPGLPRRPRLDRPRRLGGPRDPLRRRRGAPGWARPAPGSPTARPATAGSGRASPGWPT